MLSALNHNADGSPEELLRNVRHFEDSFVGDSEQFDDLTMLCLEYRQGQLEGETKESEKSIKHR